MSDIEYAIKVIEGLGAIVVVFTGVIAAITGLITAVAALTGQLEQMYKKVLLPLWRRVLWPLLKSVAILLTLVVPNGVIVWIFIYWIAEQLTSVIKNIDVFLFMVVSLTLVISIYSLFWGLWLYPVGMRSPFSRSKPQMLSNGN